MRSIKKYALLFAVVITCAVAILNGCKKTDQTAQLSKSDLAGIEQAKLSIKAQMDALGGIPQRVELNHRMQIGYADMKGNLVQRPMNPNANATSVCAGDPPDYIDVSYYIRLYTCGVGYKIRFGWIVSWDNNIVLQNPYNSSNQTKGTVKISITGNSNAYTNTTTDVQITPNGPDPNNPSNTLFIIDMTSSTVIPVSTITAPGATLRLGAYFASDCSTLDNTSIVPTSVIGLGFSTPLDSNPCTRNDKAWFQMPGVLGYRQIGISGYDPLSTCASYTAGAAPSYQRVEYSLNNGITYVPFINYTSPYSHILATGYVSRTDFARSPALTPGTYNIKIRYLNTTLNAGVPLNSLPASTNSCMNINWSLPSYTVETFPNVVVN